MEISGSLAFGAEAIREFGTIAPPCPRGLIERLAQGFLPRSGLTYPPLVPFSVGFSDSSGFLF